MSNKGIFASIRSTVVATSDSVGALAQNVSTVANGSNEVVNDGMTIVKLNTALSLAEARGEVAVQVAELFSMPLEEVIKLPIAEQLKLLRGN